MIKKIFLFLLLTTFAISSKIEINAQNVTADDNNGITVFSGNVSITRGQDIMKADNIIVYMNDKKDVEKFEATGNTSIHIISDNNETFNGSSNEFIYLIIAGRDTLNSFAKSVIVFSPSFNDANIFLSNFVKL